MQGRKSRRSMSGVPRSEASADAVIELRHDDFDERPRPDQAKGNRKAKKLGRKGNETRAGLLRAARELMDSISPVSMTVAAVARRAGMSSATFYVYFRDVGDLVLALAREAGEDSEAIHQTLRDWREGLSPIEGATRFVNAFRAYYDDHRIVFSIRNMECDRGDQRFLKARSDAARPILLALAELIAGVKGPMPPAKEAVTRAIVIFCAVERLAAVEGLYPYQKHGPLALSREDIANAEIAILADLVQSVEPDGS